MGIRIAEACSVVRRRDKGPRWRETKRVYTGGMREEEKNEKRGSQDDLSLHGRSETGKRGTIMVSMGLKEARPIV